jgi:hypothetical protein
MLNWAPDALRRECVDEIFRRRGVPALEVKGQERASVPTVAVVNTSLVSVISTHEWP